jgi:hypothetical protein
VTQGGVATGGVAAVNDAEWTTKTFRPVVQKRGAAVIAARGASSAMSAAKVPPYFSYIHAPLLAKLRFYILWLCVLCFTFDFLLHAFPSQASGDHMRSWWVGTAPGELVSMGIVSDGQYGVYVLLFCNVCRRYFDNCFG